jgi:hypothetical protein
MTDSTLERVWDARKAISQRCEFDAHKLVHFYQSRQKAADEPRGRTRQARGSDRLATQDAS